MSNALVCGAEVRTAVGLTAAATAAAVRAGVTRLREHPRFVGPDGEFVVGGYDQVLDPDLEGVDRLFALCESPLQNLLRASPWLNAEKVGCPLLMCLPEFRPGYSEQDERLLIDRIRASYRGGSVTVGARGHAGFLALMGKSALLSRQPEIRGCLIGAVDSYFEGRTLDWLAKLGRSQASNPRGGFHLGEGSGFALVQSSSDARETRSSPLARVGGWGAGVEPVTWMSDDVNTAKALSDSILEASAPTLQKGVLVEAIYCDINGERYRSDEWSTAQLRLNTVFRYEPGKPATYTTGVRACGDLGAASGPLMVAMATQSWARRYGKARNALLFSGSDSGQRAAVVLEDVMR